MIFSQGIQNGIAGLNIKTRGPRALKCARVREGRQGLVVDDSHDDALIG